MMPRLCRMLVAVSIGWTLCVWVASSEAQLSSTSGWPMLGNDARHTGQSNLLGPKFAGTAPGPNDVRSLTFYDKIKMFPATGPNSKVYVGMGWQLFGLNALNVTDPNNPVFTTKWNQNRAPPSPQGSPINTPSLSWRNVGVRPPTPTSRPAGPQSTRTTTSTSAIGTTRSTSSGARTAPACGRTATATKATSTPRPSS